MGRKKFYGVCPHCRKPVGLCCPSPSHLFHFMMTLTTAGAWMLPWLLVTLASLCRCRCHHCHRTVIRSPWWVELSEPSFSHPWEDDRFGSGRDPDFNALLIRGGLVFYASTRPISGPVRTRLS